MFWRVVFLLCFGGWGLHGAIRTVEPLGPSTRRTPLIISEIMYHPAVRSDGLNLEYIELYNNDLIPFTLGGFRITGDISYTFPSNSVLTNGAFLVLAANSNAVKSTYKIPVAGAYTNLLSRNGGTLQVRNPQGAVVLEVSFGTRFPWPVE